MQAEAGDGWNWISSSPAPDSGTLSHQSNIYNSGQHEHYFYGATDQLLINPNDVLIASVYLDPANPPSSIMLQWKDATGWDHRAYWGADLFVGWGTGNNDEHRYKGALPVAGQWFRLQVLPSEVGLAGATIDGMAFS